MKKLITAVLALLLAGIGAVALAPSASAADSTVWMCKPGESGPCDGPLKGTLLSADGMSDIDLDYRAATNPKVDCFYVYPTQSDQETPNANFDKDSELMTPTVNQARQFSRVCRVFAPVYRQYTNWALKDESRITPEVRDLAYNDVKDAWESYLENYNRGRGVILIGHSQGASHLARLAQEEIDPVPSVRKKLVSAYLIGANVFVPKGELVGGQFQRIPACESGSQTGCVLAYSAFQNQPDANASFGRVDTGYWVHPDPRPDAAKYEVLCVNPAGITGERGQLRPLANLPAFIDPDEPESERPWTAYGDYYTANCRNENGASWLQVDKVAGPVDARPDLTTLVGEPNGDNPKGNLHVGDVNLALDNLVGLAGTQSRAYLNRTVRRARLMTRLNQVNRKFRQTAKRFKRAKTKCLRVKRRNVRKAAVRRACRPVRVLKRRAVSQRRQKLKLTRQIRRLA